MSNPFFSVIINCYNGEFFLEDSIDSVYNQTFDDWEIIFWDNASTDNSSKIVHKYDKRIKYFLSKKTEPLYVARNLAIKKSIGHYLAFIDVDDLWEPNKLESINEVIKNYPGNFVYASNFKYLFNEKLSNSQYPLNKQAVFARNFSMLIKSYDIAMSTIVIDKHAFNQYKGFDEKFHLTGDKELVLRLSLTNDVIVSNQVLVYIRIHNNNETINKIECFAVENLLLIEKFLSLKFISLENINLLICMFHKVLFQRSVYLFSNKKSFLARNIIKNSFPPFKFLLFYFVSFISSKYYNYIAKLYRVIK